MLNENVVNALYDGGWTASDKEQLIEEYGFTYDEIDDIIEGLQQKENATNTSIKQWYTETFPEDEEGEFLKEDITFNDLFNAMAVISDSLVRERIFEKLAEIMQVDYDYIYDQWLKCREY